MQQRADSGHALYKWVSLYVVERAREQSQPSAMMSVVSLIVKSLLILITTHLAWRVVRRVLRKSPLDNLPGPHSAPWFMGKWT